MERNVFCHRLLSMSIKMKWDKMRWRKSECVYRKFATAHISFAHRVVIRHRNVLVRFCSLFSNAAHKKNEGNFDSIPFPCPTRPYNRQITMNKWKENAIFDQQSAQFEIVCAHILVALMPKCVLPHFVLSIFDCQMIMMCFCVYWMHIMRYCMDFIRRRFAAWPSVYSHHY